MLRCYDLAEVDRILVMFTRDFGKVRGVATGAKRLKSGFVGGLDTAVRVRVKFLEKEGADLVRIKQCVVLEHFLRRPQLAHALYSIYMTQLLEEFTSDRHANEDLFRLALASFRALPTAAQLEQVARYFEFWILRLEGVWPNSKICGVCQNSAEARPVFFSRTLGLFQCGRCRSEGSLPLNETDQNVLRDFSRRPPTELAECLCPPESLKKIEEIAQVLMRRHLEREIKSYRLLRELTSA